MSVDNETRPSRIHSNRAFEALKEAGILREADYVRRCVIDIQVNCAVVIHVERYGDTRILDVLRNLEGIEIRETSAD